MNEQTEVPVTYTVVALGDQIEQLHQLIQRPNVIDVDAGITDDLRRRCRGLVVGLDLAHAESRRQARSTLKREVIRWGDELRRFPSAVHLLIACRRAPHIPASHVQGVADGLALRIHTELERRARYVNVTLLDVTDCDDGELLADRLLERIVGAAGGYPAAALTWSEVRGRSTAAATAERNS